MLDCQKKRHLLFLFNKYGLKCAPLISNSPLNINKKVELKNNKIFHLILKESTKKYCYNIAKN